MAKQHTFTHDKYKYLKRLFFTLSLVCTWAPLIGFTVYALANSAVVPVQKLAVSITLLASIIITVFNLINKKHLRSPFYIILIGLYIGLGELLPCLITLTVTSMLDEFAFHPLYDLYKTKYLGAKSAEEVYGDLQG